MFMSNDKCGHENVHKTEIWNVGIHCICERCHEEWIE